jgi:hypothetical protein
MTLVKHTAAAWVGYPMSRKYPTVAGLKIFDTIPKAFRC